MKGQKKMNLDIQRINTAHNLTNSYKSHIAETYNGNGLLENFIRAKLTQRQTIRLLLDQEQLQEQENAIAKEIADKVMAIFE